MTDLYALQRSSIRNFILSMLITLRNYALYPEDHVICSKGLTYVQENLSKYLANHGILHLDVKENRLLFQEEVVYQSHSQDEDLPILLYRDGIQWIEFRNEVTAEELNTFMKLMTHYRILREEAEGNLVTALWESDLPHIHHKAGDVLWKEEVHINLSTLKPAGRSLQELPDTLSVSYKSAYATLNPMVGRLSPIEEKKLRAMVLEDEAQDAKEDVLNIVMTTLKQQHDPENFAMMLSFLTEEFQYYLSQAEFSYCLDFLENINNLYGTLSAERPWAKQILGDFLKRISEPEVLGALKLAWPRVNVMQNSQLDVLRRLLMLFPTDVIITLGFMLTNAQYPRVDDLITEVISIRVKCDLIHLKDLLNKADEHVIRIIISVLRRMKEHDPSNILFELVHHSSDLIARDAIATLVTVNPQNLEKIFPMIEDPRPLVRHQILKLLSRRNNELSEELLLGYLGGKRFQLKDRRHILSCYWALGQCGSSRSIPFLRESLLPQNWRALLVKGNFIHRQGAAMALLAMKDEEAARESLQKASHSLYFPVRLSYRRAIRASQGMRRRFTQ